MTEFITEFSRDALLETMSALHPDWSEARYHRDRSGGVSAQRNHDFAREAEVMDAYLEVFYDLGYCAVAATIELKEAA